MKAAKSILSLTLGFSLILSSASWAKFRPRPTTPRGPIPPMGIRGCATDTTLNFTALAPVSTIVDLSLDQTTISLYVPDRAAYDVTLRLYQDTAPTGEKPKWTVVKEFEPQKSKEGVMPVEIPAGLLKEGQIYLWQAALACVPGYPSSDLVAQAQFRVVSKPAELRQKLSQAKDAKTRSELYAAAGFWYSAFMEAKPSKAIQISLLKDLVEYEQTQQVQDPRWLKRGREHSESVAKIVEVMEKLKIRSTANFQPK